MSARRGFAPILILIFVLAASVLGGAIYLYNKPVVPHFRDGLTLPSPSETPSCFIPEGCPPEPPGTASWKTYVNQTLQFTTKYPNDWTINESTSFPEQDFYRIFFLSKGYSNSGGSIENSVAILVMKNNNYSFEQVLTNMGYKIEKETEKKIKIGSNSFSFATTLFQQTTQIAAEGSYYGIIHDNHWYIFGISVKNVADQKKVEDILSNMLSTFQFLN